MALDRKCNIANHLKISQMTKSYSDLQSSCLSFFRIAWFSLVHQFTSLEGVTEALSCHHIRSHDNRWTRSSWNIHKKLLSEPCVKCIMSRIFLKKNNVLTHTKIIPLNHHLGPTRSGWRCLYLQRLCPLPGFSYFVGFEMYLGINLWAALCSPHPKTVWGVGLYKNVATSCQIVKHVQPPEAGEEGPTLNVVFTNSNR